MEGRHIPYSSSGIVIHNIPTSAVQKIIPGSNIVSRVNINAKGGTTSGISASLNKGGVLSPSSSNGVTSSVRHHNAGAIVTAPNSIGNHMIDFKIINELGRGSYGIVYKVESIKD